jgi:hypothetical protein
MLAYAHINLLEMLQRFGPNEVVRIATYSIYIRREALYKIENVSAFFKQAKQSQRSQLKNKPKNTNKFLCPHSSPIPCAMCEGKHFPSMYPIQAVKEFQKIMPLVQGAYMPCKHKPFICADCFSDWYCRQGFWKKEIEKQQVNLPPCRSEIKEEELVREIQPGQ